MLRNRWVLAVAGALLLLAAWKLVFPKNALLAIPLGLCAVCFLGYAIGEE